ncbi:MAG: FtsX-like permease family protein [Betaproteobacteria bacterium]|nr:FtsX-like permease family protein [Betaproteobacteria bacterium]
MLGRDLRAGEFNLMALAMVVAVASLTSVAFFSDRVDQALGREANQILGGDVLLSGDHPLDSSLSAQAKHRGLAVVASTSFVSMAGAGEAAQLAGVKVVQPGYPLRGWLRIAPALNQPDAETHDVPQPGTAWLDERLTAALGVATGDEVTLGEARLRVAAVLTFEADRGASFFSFVPRIMINAADLPATGLIRPGSRVTYRLHVAGEAGPVRGFRTWAAAQLGRGERIEDIDSARPELRNALDRAGRFLRLAALLAVVLAAVAIGLGARRFLQRHLDGFAVMRCLGATQAQLSRLVLTEFLLFGVVASVVGSTLGFAAQYLLEAALSGVLERALPAPGVLPLLQGLVVGVVLLLGFAAPALARLARVPTLRVIRREWDAVAGAVAPSLAAGAAAVTTLALWMAGDAGLGSIVLAGFVAAVAVFALVARGAFAAAGRLRGGAAGGWRLGLANLHRRLAGSVVQAVALALGMTALLLLTLTRSELLDNWRRSVPPDAPNRFLINIQPEQLGALRAFFTAQGIAEPDLDPMVRGRLVAVNGRPVDGADFGEERARGLVEREFNLSWARDVPAGNQVVAGRWFDAAWEREPGFSVELGLAQTLGLNLHDRLGFEVAGSRVEAPITSLRKLDWDSMRVNFFVIAPPGVLETLPASYITSFHLPPGNSSFAHRLVAEFPNVTLVDVAAVIRQLQQMMEQLTRAVQVVFAFALAAGVAVMFAAIAATHDERRMEIAIMRTLGARNRQLRGALLAEFLALGLVAGVLAGLAANGIGAVLAQEVFRLAWSPSPGAVLWGAVSGALGTGVAGLAGTARLLRAPALQSLRALG